MKPPQTVLSPKKISSENRNATKVMEITWI